MYRMTKYDKIILVIIMQIEIVKVGNLECNCYLLNIENKILVVDPGDDEDKIVNAIGEREVVGVVVTHYHFDHIGVLENILDRYGVLVYDKNNMIEGGNNIDVFSFDVIYTPGHKEDSISIYFKEDKVMFCGDFIFKNSIGRCDLLGGNIEEMLMSINKIKEYDKDIIIYPGHGDITSLGYEINNNIYFLDGELL